MPKILVIEDDRQLREMVLKALGKQGFAVAGATDGVEGTQMARDLLPDLVLCDVKMDRLDGYGTLEALRQDTATSTIPFILMTGEADHAGMRQGMELGADDYLAKPFSIPEMLAAVQARLKKQVILREQADRRLTSLRVNISCALPHELRTPLNGILGFSEMIMTDCASLEAEEVSAMAKAIHESAQRLNRIIENTLLYAQIELAAGDEAKVQSLRQGRTPDAARVARKAGQQKAREAGRSADLCLALGDASAAIAEQYLHHIVAEVVENAFKFSPAGTPVELRTEAEGGFLALSVTDHGRGLRPENVAEIGAYMQFERRIYEQQGSGLGLTIVRRLADLHGGALAVRSDLGRGTTMTVRIPLCAPNGVETEADSWLETDE